MAVDWMNVTMEHFQNMCLNDPVMQAIYHDEISWADASEDDMPLELDGWREYLAKRQQEANAWSKPLRLTGSKRTISPPESPVKKKERVNPPNKPIPVISEKDQGKQTLFIRDIPKDVSNEDILKQIEPLGRVKRIHRSTERGFVMVRMSSVEEAQHVYLTKMKQLILKGKPRKISFATHF